jgi:hypothetical protein
MNSFFLVLNMVLTLFNINEFYKTGSKLSFAFACLGVYLVVSSII